MLQGSHTVQSRREIAEELRELLAELEDGPEAETELASHALLEAKRFSDAVGGIERARRSLEALSRLG